MAPPGSSNNVDSHVLTGETVTYTYDTLNRLASATSSQNPGWGQSYGYDGFGNLTNVNVTKGTAPTLTATYNAATNRRTTDTADANGNLYANGITAYDVANRVTAANIQDGTVTYGYAPNNQRVWKRTIVSGSESNEIVFYSPDGAKLAVYTVIGWGWDAPPTSVSYYEYFGGKMRAPSPVGGAVKALARHASLFPQDLGPIGPLPLPNRWHLAQRWPSSSYGSNSRHGSFGTCIL